MTEAEKYALSNSWCLAFACGFLDGKRDKSRKLKPAISQLEMTDYAHGYWKGYSL